MLRLISLSTRSTCFTTRSTRFSTRSTRFSTRITHLSIRFSIRGTQMFTCSTRLFTRSTRLSTRSICLPTCSTRSTIYRSFYSWSSNQIDLVWIQFSTIFVCFVTKEHMKFVKSWLKPNDLICFSGMKKIYIYIYIYLEMGFGILQHLAVTVNKGIHFIWKKLLSNFELADIIFIQKRS